MLNLIQHLHLVLLNVIPVLYQPDEKTTMEVRLDASFDTVWLLGSSVKDMGRGLLSWAKYQRKRIKVGENDYICRVLNYEIYGEGKF